MKQEKEQSCLHIENIAIFFLSLSGTGGVWLVWGTIPVEVKELQTYQFNLDSFFNLETSGILSKFSQQCYTRFIQVLDPFM